MAQIGIHGMVSMAIRKWIPKRGWLMLGVVLGSILPDLDNLAVAVATVSKQPTAGLHRTATHSLLFVAVVILFFYILGKLAKQPRWGNLGWGLGVGILLHILLDLLIWFNGVALLWPLPTWVNLWANVTPPTLWMKLMDPAELGFVALFFLLLDSAAHKGKTDGNFIKMLRVWTSLEAVLFVVFMVLAFTMSKGFATIFGVAYLLSLILAMGVTIRMRKTIETY
jgi:membrane-bound metal-dependent hydrolase YbcI (DUF457 family)